jgi:hypothetical protein
MSCRPWTGAARAPARAVTGPDGQLHRIVGRRLGNPSGTFETPNGYILVQLGSSLGRRAHVPMIAPGKLHIQQCYNASELRREAG